LVSNLPEFFNQTWANALWHDEFQDFRRSLDAHLRERLDVKMMDESLKGKLDEQQQLDHSDFLSA